MEFSPDRTTGAGAERQLVESKQQQCNCTGWGAALDVIKISSKSNPNSCAGALAGVLRSCGAVEVQVVGAGALNQAVKAVAIARTFVVDAGIDLVCVPAFAEIEIDGERRTAIRLLVEDRTKRVPVGLVPDIAPAGSRVS